MEDLYSITFALGIIYTLISFLLGNILSFESVDTDIDFGINWDDIGFFDVPISPFKPIIIAGFITVFGGVGLLTYKYYHYPMVLSFIISFTTALIAAFLLYRFIVVPLYRAQNGMVHDIHSLEGTIGVVIASIYGNTYGKIRYTLKEGVFSAPAKSLDGIDLKQGQQVIIDHVEKNVFYVRAYNKEQANPE